MPDILFATHNPWKGEQFRPTFEAYGFSMRTLKEHPAQPEPQAETGASPVENALAKARSFHSPEYPWVFADDAGLEIDALNGEPGLQARRWGGVFTDAVDDQTWLDHLLARMQAVPPDQRTARFISGWALITPDGAEYVHAMNWPFKIATQPLRPMHPGSPISAVRVGPPDDLSRRQAEIRQEWERWGILRLVVCGAEL
jgi:non-canonical purine NTP pyrophosphatase (RdgB/HAM1 family)